MEEEPLPSTSPLWTYERVLITPHSSGGFVWQSVRNYYTELVIRNIEHLKNHETLENEVDFRRVIEKLSHIKNSASALFKLLINFKDIMPVKIIFYQHTFFTF